MAEDYAGDRNSSSSSSSSSSLGEDAAIRTEEEEDEDEDAENINPLTTLLLVARSPKFHDGEMVIRSLHETLQYVINSPKDIQTVLDVMNSLSESKEPVLRTDLMEQVPQIAFLCHDHPDKLSGLITGTLVPMVVRFLTDASDMVRKTSQAALLVLLEQELVSHNDVQTQVCPAILDLTEPDAIEYIKIEAVALMSKMAPLVGREMTERFFMQRFTRLCSDKPFQVRKVCAANFGEFSGVIGTEGTENVLLPYFLNLCEDGMWGVRKACADVFMVVSCACSLETRKRRLAPLFIPLLSDESRWVRLAAFQNLGPFISTFADPSVTGLQYNEGILYIGPSPEESNQSKPLDADSIFIADLNQKNAGPSVEHAIDEPKEWPSLCLKKSIQIENSELSDTKSSEIIEQESSTTPMASNLRSEKGVSETEYGADSSNFGCIWSETLYKLEKNGLFTSHCFDSCSSNIFETSTTEDSGTGANERNLGPMSLNDDPNFNELNYWRVPLPELDLDLDFLEDLQLENSNGTPPPPEFPPWKSDETEENNSFILANKKDAFPSEEQSPEESYSTDCNTPGEDVQAELEALAASLAESIFCNDSNPQETKLLENISPEEKGAPLNESLHFNFDQEKKTSSPDKCKLTYAEICAASLTSKPKPIVAATSSEETKPVSNSSTDKQWSSGGCDSNSESASHATPENSGTVSSLEGSEDESQLRLKNMKIVILKRSDYLGIGSTSSSSGHEGNEGDGTSKNLFNVWPSEKSWSHKDGQKTLAFGGNLIQDIVPTTLLEHYISMTDPGKAETVDEEITRHCAYSLPAVALTLGRRYWSLLRKTYETLAADVHWKVRRTLAFSIHELALILGEELAQKDLLPVFEEFIRDLDEVRIGVLKHLAPFLKMLPPSQRELFLPRLHEFLNSDNINNWRFRLELALQLAPISELFSAQVCWTHICPITFNLMADKVVQIRRTCFSVISQLARQLMTENGDDYLADLSRKLSDQFARADTWKKRQSYVYVVGQLIRDASLPVSVVCSLFLPTFLDLSRDKVPNIRLVIAKIINSSLMAEYFHTQEADNMREALLRLQNDPDRDVQYFSSFPHNTEVTESQDANFY